LNISREEARLEVEDTGMGIPEEIRDRLFQPFVTHGKTRGTGLGLSIVKRIVEAHSGTITFTTAKELGTTFSITLPYQTMGRTESGSVGKASSMAHRHEAESSKT
jgi:signal transduction histidine kinase